MTGGGSVMVRSSPRAVSLIASDQPEALPGARRFGEPRRELALALARTRRHVAPGKTKLQLVHAERIGRHGVQTGLERPDADARVLVLAHGHSGECGAAARRLVVPV